MSRTRRGGKRKDCLSFATTFHLLENTLTKLGSSLLFSLPGELSEKGVQGQKTNKRKKKRNEQERHKVYAPELLDNGLKRGGETTLGTNAVLYLLPESPPTNSSKQHNLLLHFGKPPTFQRTLLTMNTFTTYSAHI